MKHNVVLLVGPSCSGKSTIMARLLLGYSKKYGRLKSFTTRPRRAGETDAEYDFITKEDYEALVQAGDVMQDVNFGGCIYGTQRSNLMKIFQEGKTAICVVEPGGVTVFKEVSKAMPEEFKFEVSVFYIAADKITLIKRWLERAAEDPSAIDKMASRVFNTIANETTWEGVLVRAGNHPRRMFFDNSGGEEIIQLTAASIDMEMEWLRRNQRW